MEKEILFLELLRSIPEDKRIEILQGMLYEAYGSFNEPEFRTYLYSLCCVKSIDVAS